MYVNNYQEVSLAIIYYILENTRGMKPNTYSITWNIYIYIYIHILT